MSHKTIVFVIFVIFDLSNLLNLTIEKGQLDRQDSESTNIFLDLGIFTIFYWFLKVLRRKKWVADAQEWKQIKYSDKK